MSTNKNLKNDKRDAPIDADHVIAGEREHLQLDRQATTSGIAISGGGIRSASFGLGVMQALVKYNLLNKIDYMSTVSGGGYLGSALTWALKQGGKDAGTLPENFPLGKLGQKRNKNTQEKVTTYSYEDNKLLDFIRLHGSYLTPASGLDFISLFAVLTRSIAMSLLVYFSFITVTMVAGTWLTYFLTNQFLNFLKTHLTTKVYASLCGLTLLDTNHTGGALMSLSALMLVVCILLGFLYSLSTIFNGKKTSMHRYLSSISGQKLVGKSLKASICFFILGTLPYVYWLFNFIPDYLSYLQYVLPSGSTLFGIITGLWQYKKAHNKEKNYGKTADLIIYAGATSLAYGLLLFAYIISRNVFLNKETLQMDHPEYYAILIVLSLLFGTMVNLNLIGPHHIWRNRLMEAFMPNKNAVIKNSWEPATEADGALMADMCDANNPRPYHIINTNIILSNSTQVDFSGRGGDNFIISPLYTGSDATQYIKTKDYHSNKDRGMTLATAMATSAAALNPNAGVSGEGVSRNIVVSILLSMLNLRLGYWASNPSSETKSTPNFIVPGFTSEILRMGMSETDSHIQLSDGGHYENLAVYELIRRKLDLIIVSDGGADPPFNFDDLANAIEKARVDLAQKLDSWMVLE
jgi:hypothetical protein